MMLEQCVLSFPAAENTSLSCISMAVTAELQLMIAFLALGQLGRYTPLIEVILAYFGRH